MTEEIYGPPIKDDDGNDLGPETNPKIIELSNMVLHREAEISLLRQEIEAQDDAVNGYRFDLRVARELNRRRDIAFWIVSGIAALLALGHIL